MAYATYNRVESVSSEERNTVYSCFERILRILGFRRRGSLYSTANNEDAEDLDSTQRSGIDSPERSPAARHVGVGDIIYREESDIYIDREHSFYLGAMLETYANPQRDTLLKCQHFLKLTGDARLANQMEIKNGEELLFLNDIFVPFLTHSDVLNSFREIEVDGQSTNKLVVRKRKTDTRSKWYELYTIFSAGAQNDEDITIKDTKSCKRETFEEELPESVHVYKIPESQRYLVIDDTGLGTRTMCKDERDNTKLIQKRTKICQHGDGEVLFSVALRDKEMSRYIVINTGHKGEEDIILSEFPQWLQSSQIGDQIHFMTDGRYLGYNHEEDSVKPQHSKFMFEEYPPPAHLN